MHRRIACPVLIATAVVAGVAAGPASRPTTGPATAPTHLRVTVWRSVDGRTVETTSVVIPAGNSPGATVVTAGHTQLTVDRVRSVKSGDYSLHVRYAEEDGNLAAGTLTTRVVSTTVTTTPGRRLALGGSDRGGDLSLRVSAAADPATQP